MRAIVIREPGGPEVLELKDVPTPEPGKGEVRVRVRATAVNRADLMQRMGMYPAPPGSPADIPGMEFAGEIDALGDGVFDLDGAPLAKGDRVLGLVGGGSYSEYVVAHARTLARMTPGMSFEEAAAIPEVFTTAYDALVTNAKMASGDAVLISAVGSGVGTAGVQIAKALGATVIGTARTESKLEGARDLGMDHGIVPKDGKFADAVLEKTNGRGVDVVLELAGGAYVAEDVLCAAPRGRIVVVGLVAGANADVNLGVLLRKRIEIHGTVLRARSLEEKIDAGRTFARRVMPLFATGKLKAIVDRVLPLERAAEAHAATAKNETFGKIVLTTSAGRA